MDGYEVRAFPVEHGITAYGYALVEEERPGRFDPEAATRLGIEEGPAWGALQRGEEVSGANGPVRPADVMGETRPGRKVVLTGDSAVCEPTRVAADHAELLIHDGSFAEEEAERARETGHSTARGAARLAKEAAVGMLALVHVSSRYNVGAVLDEARQEFPATEAPRDFDAIEVPFTEKGAPRLVKRGAKERREGPQPVAP
jgi:ribonuclease Z